MLDYADDPFRPVNWRWERVKELAGSRSYAITDDEHIRAGNSFLSIWQKDDQLAQGRAKSKHPHIYQAHRIEERDSSHKHGIQARLLAGETVEDIAVKHRTAPEVIECYERLFFNVLDALNSPDYIVHQVFGRAVHVGLTEQDYNLLWKMYGYFCGPHVLDMMIYQFEARQVIPKNRLFTFWRSDISTGLGRKSAISARTIPVNGFTAPEIMSAYTDFLKLEQELGSAGQAHDQIIDNIRKMMDCLPIVTGSKAQQKLSKDVLEYDDAAMELSSAQLLQLHAGIEPENAAEIKQFRLPPPPVRGTPAK